MGKLNNVPVLGVTWVTFGAMLLVLLLVGGLINQYGILGNIMLPSLASVIPEGVPAGSNPTTVANSPVTTTIQVSAVDIQSSARETQPDTTGVKNRVGGSLAWYYDQGVTPFETTTLSTTAYASSTTDASPGSKIIGVYTNSSYYTALVANADGSPFNVPVSPNMQVETFVDLLNTVTIKCQNTTGGVWSLTGLNQSMTTDEAVTINCKLVGGSARGVFKGPIKIGLNMSTANLSTTGTYVVGATKGTVPTGVMSDYETAWDTSLPDVTDYNEVPFQVRITAASGINPGQSNILTIKAADCGAKFTKTQWPIVFQGCENVDTLAAIGSTDPSFALWID